MIKQSSILLFLFYVTAFRAQEIPDSIMNNWHKAASEADYNAYFKVVTDDFVFLGTAPGERWNKEEFAAFSKPYFDKGKAWDFKPSNRNWSYSADGKTAWFDEDLETWMRGCRGSGVLLKKRGKWRIAYYNLTVLVENEKMDSFIELRDASIPEK